MAEIDLNLLGALDALLATGSVAGAARKLTLSASAMSRTLARLRAATGDPLLVRAGRGLVPTPHALVLRSRVQELHREIRDVLTPVATGPDLSTLDRQISIRASDGFIETYGAHLVTAIAAEAPRLRILFTPKPDKDVRPLRDGGVDLDIGVLNETGPEIRIRTLFHDAFVGVARSGHALLAGELTAARYAACRHVVVSRRGRAYGPVDEALAHLGLQRSVVAIVPSFSAAVAMALGSELIALVSRTFVDRRPEAIAQDIRTFPLPVPTAPITVSLMWHPRLDADPLHRWFRDRVVETCRGRPLGRACPDGAAP